MKTLTVKQPYASLISHGLKKYEFRNFVTHYRGPIYIHASKVPDHQALLKVQHLVSEFPNQVIVAQANLVNCILVNKELLIKLKRNNPNIYTDAIDKYKYAWVLEDIKPIYSTLKIKGQLGLWNYSINKGEEHGSKSN